MRSASRIRLLLKAERDIARPVDVARLLVSNGLSLRTAHAKLRALADDGVVAVELNCDAPDTMSADLGSLGIGMAQIRTPEIDVRMVRRGLGLSQVDFATRFGFEPDTVRNWEQGRYAPDAAARILLSIIDRKPAIVDDALTGWRLPPGSSA